jgi:PilZ domain
MPPLTTTLPGSSSDNLVVSNRRANFRYQSGRGTSARATVAYDRQRLPAEVCNASCDGISLRLAEPVPAGSLVAVELSNADGRFARTMRLRVLHAHAAADGSHVIGGSFHACRLTADDLASLLTADDDLVATLPLDRRTKTVPRVS